MLLGDISQNFCQIISHVNPLHPHCFPSKKLASGSDDFDVISADLIPDSQKTVGVSSAPTPYPI